MYPWLTSVSSSSFILVFHSHVVKCSVVTVCFLFHLSNYTYPFILIFISQQVWRDCFLIIMWWSPWRVCGGKWCWSRRMASGHEDARASIVLSTASQGLHLHPLPIISWVELLPLTLHPHPQVPSLGNSLWPQIALSRMVPIFSLKLTGQGQICQLFICIPHSHLHS